MPEFCEQRHDGSAEQPLPQEKTGQHRQVIPQPQVAAAEGKSGPEPGGEQSGAEEKLDKPGEAAVQGTQGIGGGTQQHSGQKAAGDPAPYQGRIHRSNPRRRRGSS